MIQHGFCQKKEMHGSKDESFVRKEVALVSVLKVHLFKKREPVQSSETVLTPLPKRCKSNEREVREDGNSSKESSDNATGGTTPQNSVVELPS